MLQPSVAKAGSESVWNNDHGPCFGNLEGPEFWNLKTITKNIVQIIFGY